MIRNVIHFFTVRNNEGFNLPFIGAPKRHRRTLFVFFSFAKVSLSSTDGETKPISFPSALEMEKLQILYITGNTDIDLIRKGRINLFTIWNNRGFHSPFFEAPPKSVSDVAALSSWLIGPGNRLASLSSFMGSGDVMSWFFFCSASEI